MVDRTLEARGIAAVAHDAGWRVGTLGDVPGWIYPVYDEAGRACQVRRWKARDAKSGGKYRWIPANSADRPAYYLLPGTVDAIRARGAVLIAAGEPDVLTLRAAGFENAICWFGENNVPATLLADLRRWGAARVAYYPDLDVPGLQAARKVWDALHGHVELVICQLPGEVALSGGFDLNQLWIDVAFDPAAFRDQLKAAERIIFPPPSDEDGLPPGLRDNPQEREEVQRRIWRAIADRLVKRGNKPDYFECPFDHGPDGKDFIFDPNTGRVGGCQGKHAGQITRYMELAHALDIDTAAIARQVAADVRSKKATKGDDRQRDVSVPNSAAALTHVENVIDRRVVPDVEPFLAPYKPLHKLGGLARIWLPRKVVMIIGASGSGKTAMVETMTDALRAEGQDVLMWGPEWSSEEYQQRAIAAYGGPSLEQLLLDEIAAIEEARNIPHAERVGKPLSADQRASAHRAIATIRAWRGQAHYLDRGHGPLSDILSAASDKLDELRAERRRVQLVAFDYAQKALVSGESWSELELILNEIAQFAVDTDVVALVVSQVNKDVSAKSREGKLLDQASAQLLSDQKPNLIITLNPRWENGERYEEAWIRAVKNSLAPCPAKIRVKTALYRHRWTDTVLTDAIFEHSADTASTPDDEEPPPLLLDLDHGDESESETEWYEYD